MNVQVGKRIVQFTRDDLIARLAHYALVLIDIGTGDGRFVYHWAARHPDTYCIGIDPVGEQMRALSYRATRKPSRGGRENVLFVVANVNGLPHELHDTTDILTINFPWASLLKALIEPDLSILASLRKLIKMGGRLTMLFNQSVFEDLPYADRLGLPPMSIQRIQDVLLPGYLASGFEITDYRSVEGDIPHATSWGQHLRLASGRKTLLIEALATEARETT